jgi:ABC-2 type transport system permease protein
MTMILWRKLLRDIRTAFLVVFLILMGFQMLWVLIAQRVTTEFSPLFRGVANRIGVPEDAFQKQFFSGPGKVMQSIMGGENVQFNRPQDMLAVGYLHPVIQILLCIWAVGRASGAIAGEIEKGTMELLLAQPLKRSRVILAHLSIDIVVIPLLAIALWFGTMLGSAAAGPFEINASKFEMFSIALEIQATTLEVHPERFLPSVLNVAGLLFAVSGLTMWLSAGSRSRNRVIGIAVLFLVVQILINIIGQIYTPFEPLRPFTLFYYYQPQLISLQGEWLVTPGWLLFGWKVQLPFVLVLIVIGSVGYWRAWRRFEHRDLPAPL